MQNFSVDPHQLEELLNYCVDFAKQMLRGYGGFHPFGAVLRPDQKVVTVGGYNGEEYPKGADLFLLLKGSMKADYEKQQIIAAAIATDVNIPKEYKSPYPDGIRVLLECAGYSRFVYLPYRASKPGLLGRLIRNRYECEFGEFLSVDIPPMITGDN